MGGGGSGDVGLGGGGGAISPPDCIGARRSPRGTRTGDGVGLFRLQRHGRAEFGLAPSLLQPPLTPPPPPCSFSLPPPFPTTTTTLPCKFLSPAGEASVRGHLGGRGGTHTRKRGGGRLGEGGGGPDSDHAPPVPAGAWVERERGSIRARRPPHPGGGGGEMLGGCGWCVGGFASALCHARINLERLHRASGFAAAHNELSPWLSVAVLATTGRGARRTRPPGHGLGPRLCPPPPHIPPSPARKQAGTQVSLHLPRPWGHQTRPQGGQRVRR